MHSSILSVSSAAADTTLLSLDELKAATGVTGTGSDSALTTLGARVAASIARACKLATDGVTPPTLRSETLVETFRLRHPTHELVLSRRPIVSVSSVTENDVAVVSTDYETQNGAGVIRRLCSDYPAWFPCGKVVVTYVAGWATVPDDLKKAAARYAGIVWMAGSRDPGLKRERIEGVGEFDYWVPPTSDPAIPSDVMDDLAPYINYR
jgi:hypothetical protein